MNTKKLGRLLSMAFLAVALVAILTVSAFAIDATAPTGLTSGENGNVEGLAEGNYYQIVPVVLNSAGDGMVMVEDEIAPLTAQTTGLAGLYKARFANADYTETSDWSDMFYVYGEKADRANVGLTDEGNFATSADKTKVDFVTGVWASKTAQYYPNYVYGTMSAYGAEYFNGMKTVKAMHFAQVKYFWVKAVSEGTDPTAVAAVSSFIVKVNDAKAIMDTKVAALAAPQADLEAKKAAEAEALAAKEAAAGTEGEADANAAYEAAVAATATAQAAFDAANLPATQATTAYEEIKAVYDEIQGITEADAATLAAYKAARDAAFEADVTRVNAQSINYGYNPDEIISIAQLEKFAFYCNRRQGEVLYDNDGDGFSSDVEVFITDLDGVVTSYRYTTNSRRIENLNGRDVDFTDKAAWTPALPNEGYVVGLKIYPWSGMSDYDKFAFDPVYKTRVVNQYLNCMPQVTIKGKSGTTDFPYTYQIGNRQYDALKGVSGGFGEIKGLVDGAVYQYAEYSINASGTGLVMGEWKDLDREAIPSGLISLRKHVKTEDDIPLYTAASDMFYVYGAKADRANLGVVNNALALSKTKTQDFIPGYWTAKTDGVEGLALRDNTGWIRGLKNATVPSSEVGYLLKTEYEILKGLANSDTTARDAFVAEYETAKATYDGIESKTTAHTNFMTSLAELKTRLGTATTATATEVAQAKTAWENYVNKLAEAAYTPLTYAFDASNITSVNELGTFTFKTNRKLSSIRYHGISSEVVLYVADMKGNVTAHRYETDADYKLNPYGAAGEAGYDISVTYAINLGAKTAFEPALPETGYLVGMRVYQWANMNDPEKYSFTLRTTDVKGNYFYNTTPFFTYISYTVTDPVSNEKLTGIEGGFGEIKGLDSDETYQYATYHLDATGSAVVPGDWKAFDPNNVPCGLLALRRYVATVEGAAIYTIPSDLIYVYGSAAARNNVGNDGTVVPPNQKVSEFVEGKWTSLFMHYYGVSNVTGPNGMSDTNGWLTGSYSIGTAWQMYIENAEYKIATELLAGKTGDNNTALVALKADIAKISYADDAAATVKTAKNELIAAGTALIDKYENKTSITQAEVDALDNTRKNSFKTIFDEIATRNVSYTYEADEVVDINEANTFTFAVTRRSGYFDYEGHSSAVEAYVANLDGTVSVHRYTTPADNKTSSVATETVYFQDKADWTPALPAEGYLVGIKIYPWVGMDNIEKLTIPELTNGPTFAFIGWMPKVTVEHNAFNVNDPSIGTLTGVSGGKGEIIGLEDGATYQYRAYTMSSDGASLTIGAWTDLNTAEIPLGVIELRKHSMTIGTEKLYTEPVLIGVQSAEPTDIIHLVDVTVKGVVYTVPDQTGGKTGPNLAAGEVAFVVNKWAGSGTSNGSNPFSRNYKLGSGTAQVHGTVVKALYEATAGTDAYAAAYKTVLDYTTNSHFAYAYSADEVIPVSSFGSFSFTPYVPQNTLSILSGNFKSKLVLKVITEDGKLVDRVATKDAIWTNYLDKSEMITFARGDYADQSGYIVGMILYPYGAASDDLVIKPTSGGQTNLWAVLAEDAYTIVSDGITPEVAVSKATNGYEFAITNAVDGAYYEYSTDNKNWTTLEMNESVFVVDEIATYYVRMADKGGYHASGVVVINLATLEFAAKPELELDGNVLSVEDGIYEYYKLAFGTETEYQDLSTTELSAGLYVVRVKATATMGASEPQYIYIAGEDVGTLTLVTKYNSDGFIPGVWTGNFSAFYNRDTNEWKDVEVHMNANVFALNERRSFAIKYQFTDDEIVPLADAIDIVWKHAGFYSGYINEGSTADSGNGSRTTSKAGQTKARVYVAGGDVEYYDIITEVIYSDSFKFNIGSELNDKPGYITAIELYPFWSIYGADNKTDLGNECYCTAWNSTTNAGYWPSYTFKIIPYGVAVANELPSGETLPTKDTGWDPNKDGYFAVYSDGTNRFTTAFVKQKAETPVISLDKGNVVTVNNYNANFVYAYSADGGETWTEFEGRYFYTDKIATDYVVKAVGTGLYYESEASDAITSSDVAAVAGVSLVLDGQVGVKVYIDVADDAVIEDDSFRLEITRVNADYECTKDDPAFLGLYRQLGTVTLTSETNWATKVQYDADKDLYYTIIYVPAKDIDNVRFETSFRVNGVNFGKLEVFYVADYLNAAKALAAAGNEEFVAALELINNIENYTAYADNYFGKGALEAYTSAAAEAEFTAPTRTNDVPGLSFVATSLVLEDNVTIRHYFTVTDAEVFETYTSAIDYKVKGDYVYYDITDIAAQDIGAAETLTINDANGNPIYSVTYSVANYIQNMLDSDDANLVSLVNAMYDYYVAAVDYTK